MEENPANKREKLIYQLLLHCGQQRTVMDFCCQLVRELPPLIPYNQARVIFIDKSGQITGARLFGVKESKWRDFLYYYENNMVFKQFHFKEPHHLFGKDKIMAQNYWCYMDQQSEFQHDFVNDYVRSLRLLHALGIGFCDQENCLRSILALERMKDPPFQEREVEMLRQIHPLLENYHIDLLLQPVSDGCPMVTFEQSYSLTKREAEITGLLMEGLTPALISQRIGISIKTVNRHIANIYTKCRISNRQQLYKLFSGFKEN